MLTWVNGFDLSADATEEADRWTSTSADGTSPWELVAGRYGGKAVHAPSTVSQDNHWTLDFAPMTHNQAAQNTVIAGFAFKFASINFLLNNPYKILEFGTSSPDQVSGYLVLDANRNLHISTNDGATRVASIGNTDTVLGSYLTPLALDTWYYIELYYSVEAGATPRFEVRLGVGTAQPVVIISYTGSAITNPVDRLWFQAPGEMWFDDVYLITDLLSYRAHDYLGQVYVKGVLPAAEGTNAEWAATGGTNPGVVSDSSDATLIAGDAAGERATYTFTPAIPTDATVHGVQVVARGCAAADPGAPGLPVVGLMLSGGDELASPYEAFENDASVVAATWMTEYSDSWEGAATGQTDWTAAAVNDAATEFGVKVAA